MSDSAGGIRQHVLFRLRAEEYGFPVEKVRSIVRYETPTYVPRAPDGVQGVLNLRGQVIPVVDLGERLLGSAIEPTAAARIIVIESEFGLVGLAVDSASEVVTFDAAEVRPAPQAVLVDETSDAFEGVIPLGDRLVVLIDPEKVLPGAAALSTLPGQEDDLDA
jgi:purine-binding chemotaxis protein CheW